MLFVLADRLTTKVAKQCDCFNAETLFQDRSITLNYDLGYYDDIALSDKSAVLIVDNVEYPFTASPDKANATVTIPPVAAQNNLSYSSYGNTYVRVYVDLYKDGALLNDDYQFLIKNSNI